MLGEFTYNIVQYMSASSRFAHDKALLYRKVLYKFSADTLEKNSEE